MLGHSRVAQGRREAIMNSAIFVVELAGLNVFGARVDQCGYSK